MAGESVARSGASGGGIQVRGTCRYVLDLAVARALEVGRLQSVIDTKPQLFCKTNQPETHDEHKQLAEPWDRGDCRRLFKTSKKCSRRHARRDISDRQALRQFTSRESLLPSTSFNYCAILPKIDLQRSTHGTGLSASLHTKVATLLSSCFFATATLHRGPQEIVYAQRRADCAVIGQFDRSLTCS